MQGKGAATERRRVVIFSQRALTQDVSRCSGFEFEDVVAGVERAILLSPTRPDNRFWMFRAKRYLSQRSDLFARVPSGVGHKPLGNTCDLFCCFVQKPVECLGLDAVPDWRSRSGLAVCVIEELWTPAVTQFLPLMRSLAQFDLITCAFEALCPLIHQVTGRPVIHLPGAADLMRFATPRMTADRPVDVYYMGRKRPELHSELLTMMRARDGFYLYDSSARPPIAADHVTHRDLLASLVQRSKLFMVDYAKIGHSDQRQGEVSWGPRHVEGMAGGAVQVGYAPTTADYQRHFDWPEAVVRLSETPAEAAAQVARMLDDPAEMDRRRRVNLAHALARHDWLHRWALVLDHFGLPETAAMAARRDRLAEIATGAENKIAV